MPEIKCEHGHAIRVGTDEWLETLTLDQLRYAKEKAEEKIKKAEEKPRRTVWCVCSGGEWVDDNYREEDFEKAADHLLRIYKQKFAEEASDFLKEPYGTRQFQELIPRIEVERVTQHEYETEWFPPKP